MDPLVEIPQTQQCKCGLVEARDKLEAAENELLAVTGPHGQPMQVGRFLWLGIEKFRRPRKHYRLIYMALGKA